MRLSLRVEFDDCEMTRQCEDLENYKVLQYLVEYQQNRIEMVYRDY